MKSGAFHHFCNEDKTITFPFWMKALAFMRWIFVFLALVRLNLPSWLCVTTAVIYVFSDSFIRGVAEVMQILATLAAFVYSVYTNGLLSWYSLVFLLFVIWYVVGGIVSSHWYNKTFGVPYHSFNQR